MGVASLVLGILSIVFAFIPGVAWIGPILGIIGIILAAIQLKTVKDGVTKAGLVLSIIGTAVSLVFWIACALAVNTAVNTIGRF